VSIVHQQAAELAKAALPVIASLQHVRQMRHARGRLGRSLVSAAPVFKIYVHRLRRIVQTANTATALVCAKQLKHAIHQWIAEMPPSLATKARAFQAATQTKQTLVTPA